MISLINGEIDKSYRILSVPENVPCLNCNPCTRLKKLEIGLLPGEIITVENHTLGIWVIKIEENGVSRYAMRDEEVKNIFVEEVKQITQ